MRLLHTTLTPEGLFEQSEFAGDGIPRYAILSHAWGDSEITLRDVEAGRGRGKAGHEKVEKCCDRAKADGFDYAWVDTCCIDKTSSAELSEAINSMYRWYQNADICYAYLSDVPSSGARRFEESRWFTRGLTLQELIAPSRIIFFDQTWVEIGTKTTLGEMIMHRTGIPFAVLNGDPGAVERATVAQRMSWASTRQTTRVEDIAYCLLGIFGVNMPLLYGEGERAFIRLQEEIIKISDDHSIFAWQSE
ncbi:heterokaryon incompatibility protein-domain-containing protein, partial [Immersiella caudata]